MTAHEFVHELQSQMEAVLTGLDELPVAPLDQAAHEALIDLLKIALKSEIEASEVSAFWMPTTPELDVKLGLARQCGDEARHYEMIQQRLQQLGVDVRRLNPVAHGYSPLYHYLRTLHSTVERLAAGQFAREGIAQKRNRQFVDWLESTGDEATARMYRETVTPEEDAHHEFAVQMLQKYANTPDAQERARAAMLRTLELADELRDLAVSRTGVSAIPGS
jgi:1,2-phenylacetyl-CoA epoxidase catalytic subunit